MSLTIAVAGLLIVSGLIFSNGCRAAGAHERYLIETAAAARAMLVIGEQWYIGRQCGWEEAKDENGDPVRLGRTSLLSGVDLSDSGKLGALLKEYEGLMPDGLLDADPADGIPDIVSRFERLRVDRQGDAPPLLLISFRYDAERLGNVSLENFGERVALQGISRPEPVTVHNCSLLPGGGWGCTTQQFAENPRLVWSKQLDIAGPSNRSRRFLKEANNIESDDGEDC